MGKAWDATGIAHDPVFWFEVLRVLKPGGHLIAFASTRTDHRLKVAVEDAGFEIRDTMGWVYYSGFPKSLDPAKNGAPAWSGWGTALKPAFDPAVLARRPLEGTVTANVLRHGTGALHIDACRLAPGDRAWVGPDDGATTTNHVRGAESTAACPVYSGDLGARPEETQSAGQALGRWPANLYYTPKAPVVERERGCEDLPVRTAGELVDRAEGSAGLNNPRAGAGRTSAGRRNHHPTVKPVRLMRWLVRLVTPPGGVVLDPFLGSGTTGIAAVLEGLHFIGAEREDEYAAIAEARIAHALSNPEQWTGTAPGPGGRAP